MPTRRAFLAQATAVGLGALGSSEVTWSATTRAETSRRRPGIVNTVQGPLDASKLGFTLTHEHLCVSSAGFWRAWPEYFGGAKLIAKAVDKLKEAKDEGVETIVDVTPIDVGRDIRLIEEISRKSGMQIIACTGHWLNPSQTMSALTVAELYDFFIKEIEHGIEGTDIKAGVIKLATDREGVTPFLLKALKAGARASKDTGIPIETHSYAPARIGEKQAEIFEAEGLDSSKVCIGHSDDSNDMAYLIGLARRGYMLGMDHLPQGIIEPDANPETSPSNAGPLSWQTRAENIKKLIDAGFGDRIFLSNDWMFGLATFGAGVIETLEKRNPDGMLFNTRKTIPYLRQIGVSEKAIRTITVDNPRRFFGGA